MIYDIEFNNDHDMFVQGADIAFTDEFAALKQKLTIRLQFLFEEWFLDNRVGVPYTQFIFLQGSSLDDIYSIFRQEIFNTEGVKKIVSLELEPSPGDKGLIVNFIVNDGIANTIEVSI